MWGYPSAEPVTGVVPSQTQRIISLPAGYKVSVVILSACEEKRRGMFSVIGTIVEAGTRATPRSTTL